MLLSWETRLFFAVLVLTCGFAWWKGGRTERWGAAAFIAAWLASTLAQMLSHSFTPTLSLAVIDILLLLALVRLAWKSTRSWPALAAGLQAAAIAAHLAFALRLGGPPRVYLTALTVASYGELLVLAIGAWRHWRGAPPAI
ncbi:MAG TPA: hypothetical protein VF559_07985 [Caulobacteraceae bacterium]